jgi:hypothetical protein
MVPPQTRVRRPARALYCLTPSAKTAMKSSNSTARLP